MIRPFTLLTAVIFLLSGAYMFAIKHRAEATAVQISQIDHQSLLDAQRIRVLQAQWALETDPDRLSQLAASFTALKPMKPVQLVTMASLVASLPPPGAPMPGQNPQTNMPLDVPAQVVALPLPPDAPPAAAPVRVAALRTNAVHGGLSDVEHLLHRLNAPNPARPVRVARATPPVRLARAAPVMREMPGGAQIVATRALDSVPEQAGSLLGMAQTGVGN